MPTPSSASETNRTLGYGLFVLAVVVIATAGYAGYALYPRFDLPAASGVGLLVLAAAAGIASFFSPCSFALLATLLSGESGPHPDQHASPRRAFRYASALASGAALFMLLAGIVIALGGSVLFSGITFTSTVGITIRAVIGLLLIGLGLIQIGLVPVSFHGTEGLTTPLLRRQARLRKEHPMLAFGLFGFAYILAGFG
ncbi:MAG TPA: cytochrome c biogenesis protein CcdA [Chloroflexota bacterium]|nr:cytochrome c biogenesis protein CcdA [Chloroflexota bacterium]